MLDWKLAYRNSVEHMDGQSLRDEEGDSTLDRQSIHQTINQSIDQYVHVYSASNLGVLNRLCSEDYVVIKCVFSFFAKDWQIYGHPTEARSSI